MKQGDITFPSLPPIGLAISHGGQRFDLVDTEDHQRKDGTWTKLLVWQTECATCGEGFMGRSPAHSLPQVRRCEEHRQPGKRVGSP